MSTIQAYLYGRSPIPVAIAKFAMKLDIAFKELMSENEITNSRKLKKVIDGKIFSTQNTEVIKEESRMYGSRDFRNYEEELYRTRSGRFFLAGNGGPMSKYAIGDGNGGADDGEKNIPLTEDETKAWMQENAEPEEYIAIFGNSEEA